jgi:hypothetical protein
VNQDDLELVRQQFESYQLRREGEAQWIEALLDYIEERLDQLEKGLKIRDSWDDGKRARDRQRGEPRSPDEFEREYWTEIDRKFRLERRLHDLVREERDDLDHIAKLEGRERARELAMRRLHAEPPERVGRPDRTHTTGTVRKNRQHKRRSTKATTDERNN